ncbi:MAG: DEAD/DEAH box helicase family protein, partial [Bdellovibrionales bacterium]|nr:DEAD/DEAH box helicase family protein [Oligoflexia bacterium]
MYVKVAVPRPLDSEFDYSYDEKMLGEINVGDLVRVPFGRTSLNACVLKVSHTPPDLPPKVKLKAVKEKLHADFRVPECVLDLARFGAEYYQYPIGEALFIAVPPKPDKILSTRAVRMKDKAPSSRKLSAEQNEVLGQIEAQIKTKADSVFLLEGITGSGKTEVYIELAKRVLSEGKSVLILVPEIALTAQLKDRFESGLGIGIALWHSALSDGLRQTQWRKVKSGEYKVVIGARSAIFAPFQNLGLIVVDEEHDQTYKQEERFRYQARDLALYRAKQAKIPV